MKSERLFRGLKCADSFGTAFQFSLVGELGWRFKSDLVTISFTVKKDLKDKGKRIVLPNIDIINSVFTDGSNSKTISIGTDEPDEVVYVLLRFGVFIVMTYKNYYFGGLDVGVYGYNIKPECVYSDKKDAAKEGEDVGLIKDFVTDQVIGFACKEDIYYHTCKEYTNFEKNTVLGSIKCALPRNSDPVLLPSPEQKKHFLSAVLLTKGENEYIKEWIEVNRKAGFDFFYILDNNDEDSRITIEDESVLVIPFKQNRQLQYEAYDYWCENFLDETTWVAFIDTDEMFEGDIRSFLENNSAVGEWVWEWTNHGANKLIHRTDKSDSFRDFGSHEAPNEEGYTKTILRTDVLDKTYVHAHLMKPGVMVEPYKGNEIKLHHFITRSLEEYVYKIYRGSCDPIYLRKLNEFIEYNPDMKEDYESYIKDKNLKMEQ